MSNIVTEIRLIYAESRKNSNKHWIGILYDDDTVITEWGRVGKKNQSANFPASRGGASFLRKKEKEKLKKGYTPVRTVKEGESKTVTHDSGDLHAVAKSQIQATSNSPELNKLIERLVRWNIHSIVSTTQITYNGATGLFSTPLGVVTQDGIDEARGLLVSIKDGLENQDNDWYDGINSYFRIVPQDIGMKFDVNAIFPDTQSVVRQSDILDSLEASYKALQTKPASSKTVVEKEEQVFDVSLDLIEDSKIFDRIVNKYKDTRKGMHVASRLSVKRAFFVRIASMADAFEERAKKINNVRELWHGTKKANLLSILKGGLRISPPNTAHIAGKMFGNGIYFASDSTKSLNYSYGYWDGNTDSNCFMFLGDVALGKAYTPSGYGGGSRYPVTGYDSTWAKHGKSGIRNDEFIVYNNNQCNLTILVEFN